MGWTESTHLTILEPRVTDYHLKGCKFFPKKNIDKLTSKREDNFFCANLLFLVQIFYFSFFKSLLIH